MPELIARRAVVHGRVQGVFFRDRCRHEALSRGVSGWVRNRDDGTVEAVFEGRPEAVEAMTAWCGHGPGGAAVEHVDVSVETPMGLHGFLIAS